MIRPVKMTREELADELERMAYAIRTGDSYEGGLQYTCLDDAFFGSEIGLLDLDELGRDGFYVGAAYRIGNQGGQGGMRVLWDVT